MAGKKYLFGVGINKFRGGDIEGQDLQGCVNDIAARGQTRDNLVKRFGFKDADITMLFDERATKAEIWKRLNEYVHALQPGDTFVWWQSCHGSRFPLKDEKTGMITVVADVLCATDFTWDKPVLTGPAIKALFSQIRPGVKVICSFDACHSGNAFRDLRPPTLVEHAKASAKDFEEHCARATAIRNAKDVVKTLGGSYAQVGGATGPLSDEGYRKAKYIRPPADILHRFRKLERGIGQNPERGETPKGLLFFSGCDFDETSADAFFGGEYHGASTYNFWKAVNASPVTASFLDLILHTRKLLKAGNYSQNPGLEGDPDEAKGAFLGGSLSEHPVSLGLKEDVAPAPAKPSGNFLDGYDLPEDWV